MVSPIKRKTTTKKQTATKPITKKPVAKKPVAKKPVAKKPVNNTYIINGGGDKKRKTLKIVTTIIIIALAIFLALSALGKGFEVLADVFNWFPKSESIIDNPLDYGFTAQSNGGLTLEEVVKQRADNTKPYADDVVRNFYIRETSNYVILHREALKLNGVTVYPNILFVKTNKGLIWDGAIGVTAKIPVSWWSAKHDFTKAVIELDMNQNANVISQKQGALEVAWNALKFLYNAGATHGDDNVVTFSDFKVNFAVDFWKVNIIAKGIQKNNETALLKNYIHNYLFNNVIKTFFQNFTDTLNVDVELIQGSTETENLELINSYATHLWQQSKTTDKTNSNKLVSLEDYFNTYIPKDLQKNYPVPAEKKAELGNNGFYAMYENKVIANVYYTYENTNIPRDSKTVAENTKIWNVAPTPERIVNYTLLTAKLNNSNNSDLTNFNIVNTPVTINFGNKAVKFNDKNALQNGKQLALETGKVVNWNINSEGLMFNSYSGVLTPTGITSIILFNYTYLHDYVDIEVKLNNLSSIDLDRIDLVKNPVTIVFTGKNGEGTHQFKFDNNATLTSSLGAIVKKGTYNYTILSNQLIFGNTTGDFEITATNRVFVFNYAIKTEPGEEPETPYYDNIGNPLSSYNIVLNKITKIAEEINNSYVGSFDVIGSFNIPNQLRYFRLSIYNENMSILYESTPENALGMQFKDSSNDFSLNSSTYNINNVYIVKLDFKTSDSTYKSITTPIKFYYDQNQTLLMDSFKLTFSL